MAISPEQKAQMEAIIQAGRDSAQNIPQQPSGSLTPQKRAEMDAIIKASKAQQQAPEQENGFLNFAKDVAKPFIKMGGAVAGLGEGTKELGFAGISKLTGNEEKYQEHLKQAQQSVEEGGFIGRATGIAPVGSQPQSVFDFGKDVVGTGVEIGSYLAPVGAVGALGKPTSLLTKVGTGAGYGALGGSMQAGGAELAEPDSTFGSVAKETALGGLAGGVLGGAFPAVGSVFSKGSTAVTNKITGGLADAGIKTSQDLLQKGAEASDNSASRLLNSLIKPSDKEFSFGRDIGKTLLGENLTAPTLESYSKKIIQRRKEVGAQMDALLLGPEFIGVTRNIQPAINTIDKSIDSAIKAGEKTLVKQLQDIKNALEYTYVMKGGKLVKSAPRETELSLKEIQQLKIEVAEKMRFTGQAFDSDVNQARLQVYLALNKMINDAIPIRMQKLNDRWGGLMGAEKSIEKRLIKKQRGDFINTSDVFTGVLGVSAVGPAGLSLVALKHFFQSTPFKTQLANILGKFGKQDIAEDLLKAPVKEQTEIIKKLPILERIEVKNILNEARDAIEKLIRTGVNQNDEPVPIPDDVAGSDKE